MHAAQGNVLIHTTRRILAGREFLHVSVAGQPAQSPRQESRKAIEDALAAISDAGFSTQALIRSRLFARDAQLRRIASDVRLETLVGPLRSASSSYVDARRLPPQSSMSIDLVAMRANADAQKLVREYEPQIAPPMFVTLDGMAYLSGVTDMSDDFDAQLVCIRDTIKQSVQLAGGDVGAIVNIDAHISRAVNVDHAWRAIGSLFPAYNASISLTQVDGYSAPQKLVELETTLVISS